MIRMGILFGLLVCVSAVWADVESGPKVGDKLEPFKAFEVEGAAKGKEVDYTKDRKEEPTVYVFVQREFFTRPMARFLKKIDSDVKEANDKAAVVFVFLGEKPADIKEYLPKVQMSIQFANSSIAVFEGEKAGPNLWGINTDAHLTVVFADKAKVVANFAFQSVNETDAKKIVDAVKKK